MIINLKNVQILRYIYKCQSTKIRYGILYLKYKYSSLTVCNYSNNKNLFVIFK